VVVVNREFVREYEGDDGDPGKILGTPLLGAQKEKQAVVVGVLNRRSVLLHFALCRNKRLGDLSLIEIKVMGLSEYLFSLP
jgi:hypothetical protein